METTKTSVYLSTKGFKELQKQITNLEKDHAAALSRLRDMDKTDSRDERFARIEQLSRIDNLENEIASKKETLAHAKHLPRKRDALKVAIGSVVNLLDTSGRMVQYTIVDSIEANPSDGRISAKSPLGQKLIGKQMKDVVEWGAGLKTKRFQLVSIG